ncbi:MAG: PAS domain S-box protein [Gallionella sp.]|nr:PAS domain S-box protein [Gallionella sp.]
MAALDAVDDLIFLHDKDFRILRCNKAYQRCAGIPFKQIIGQPYYEIFPKTAGPLPFSMRAMKKAEEEEEEEEVMVGDATYLSRSFSIKDEQGAYLYSVHILEDITARKQSESLLQQERDFSDGMVDTAQVIILVLNPQGQIVRFNRYMEDLTGYSLNEVRGKDWFSTFLAESEREETRALFLGAIQDIQTRGNVTALLTKDGPQRLIEWYDKTLKDVAGNTTGLLSVGLDVTERKHSEAQLRASEEKHRLLFESSRDALMMLAPPSWKFTSANTATLQLFGAASVSEFTALGPWNVSPDRQPDGRSSVEKAQEMIATAMREGSHFFEWEHQRIDGMPFPADVLLTRMELEGQVSVQATVRDISERKNTENKLRATQEKIQNIFDSSPNAIYLVDLNGMVAECNQTTVNLHGYSNKEELLGTSGFNLVVENERQHARELLGDLVSRGAMHNVELTMLRKDGSQFRGETAGSVLRDPSGKPTGIVVIMTDITERKVAEERLLLSSQLLDNTADSIMAFDFDGNFIYLNEAAWKTRGYTRDELMAMNLHALDVPAYEKFIEAKIVELMEQGTNTFEAAHRCKDGSIMPIEVTSLIIESGGRKIILSSSRNITERKKAEESLRRANRALKTLSAGNLALVRAMREDELLQEVVDVIVEQGGYSMAAVYYAEDDSGESIKPMAWAGIKDSYYSGQIMSWAATEQAVPLTRAIRSRTPQICRDIAVDPGFKAWKDAALTRGNVSNIALPLTGGGRTFGGLSIFSSDVNAFDEEEVRLLEELTNDLAYGITTLRTRREHEQHTKILHDSLEQSIQTIADTVEARDPYTAGHQRRVAELATAIAREMGLSENQLRGLHLAAIIHDLGKIHIPSEILSKPGRLSTIEYMLIKEHPQDGYDILKNVKFPWPIADMVLQHHERLDGSGYPQGLKGDAILLEARILCVADVVEAMSSHRPYRPGLGINAALEEINLGRGTHYDSQVVDACVTLFNEKNYVIPT